MPGRRGTSHTDSDVFGCHDRRSDLNALSSPECPILTRTVPSAKTIRKSAPVRPDADAYAVPAVDRALSILELLARHPAGLRMREIAEDLALPANSVFRITARLEERGYIQRDSADMQYRLTRKLLSLGYAAIGEDKFVEHALDIMKELRDETQETVLLGTRTDTEGVVLECIAATQPLKFLVDAGVRFPLHTSAPGKALVAALPDAERAALLNRLTFRRFNERTITSRERFEAELRDAQAAGYALDRAEEIEGVHCVAAPILNHRGQPVAAIWITAPQFRLPEGEFPTFGRKLLRAAGRISRRLGFKGAGG